MNKRSILILSAAAAGLLLMSNSNQPSTVIGNRSGVLGAGTEGCDGSSCHGSQGSYPISIILQMPGGDTVVSGKYQAGGVYYVTIYANPVAEGNFPEWGFQLSGKRTGIITGSLPGSLAPSTNVSVNLVAGYEVAEQFSPLPTTSSGRISQSVLWNAPSDIGSGSVTFYASVLASNNDGFASGDIYRSVSRVLTEEIVNGINEVAGVEPTLRVWPNPANSRLSIATAKAARVRLITFGGAVKYDSRIPLIPAQGQLTMDVRDLPRGIYLIQSDGRPSGTVVLE